MKKMALSFAVVSLLLLELVVTIVIRLVRRMKLYKRYKRKSMIPRTAVSKDYYRTVIPLKEQKGY